MCFVGFPCRVKAEKSIRLPPSFYGYYVYASEKNDGSNCKRNEPTPNLERDPEDPNDYIGYQMVTAQVGDLVQDRRRDFAKDVGSQVRASMMAQPCFLAVEKNERMSAKSTAPSTERKPPEIFWRNFIMRPSRSA